MLTPSASAKRLGLIIDGLRHYGPQIDTIIHSLTDTREEWALHPEHKLNLARFCRNKGMPQTKEYEECNALIDAVICQK